MSGGFGVHDDCIHTLPLVLNTAFMTLGEKAQISQDVHVDAVVTLSDITKLFIKEQMSLAPFGIGNPKPLYLFENIRPKTVSVFGKVKEHTKLTFETDGVTEEAIAFFMMPEDFKNEPKVGQKMQLYAHVEESFFMGKLQMRLRIVDIF